MNPDVERIMKLMEEEAYIADRTIATAVHLATEIGKPLLIEGEAGVGKTEVAKVLARVLGTNLIRLQCYEGLDAASTLYEWNYQRQLLRIRMDERDQRGLSEREQEIFGEEFLLKRPLLQAITQETKAPVLLIDEVDRADEEFEAFCLEVLSDFQITIPELGTIKAKHRPAVVLTSNRTRELSDALRRRCLYLWIDYPDFEKELHVVLTKVPGINRRLAEQVCAVMQILRRTRLGKTPGVAESLDWGLALMLMHVDHLDKSAIQETLGCVFKDPEDYTKARTYWLDLLMSEVEGAGNRPGAWSASAKRLEDRVAAGSSGGPLQ